MRCAPMASDSVTVGRRPSGTSATVTPIAKRNPSEAGDPTPSAMPKNAMPTPTAIIGHRPHDPVELVRERALRPTTGLGQLRDRRQAGSRSGRLDDGPSLPFDHECSRKELTARVDIEGNALPVRSDVSMRRACASMTRRSADTRSPALEHDEVVDDELGRIDLHGTAVSNDDGPAREKISESLGRVLGSALLHEGEHAVDHDDDEDAGTELRHARDERQRARHPQHEREEVNHLGRELAPGRGRSRARQHVGPVATRRAVASDAAQTRG